MRTPSSKSLENKDICRGYLFTSRLTVVSLRKYICITFFMTIQYLCYKTLRKRVMFSSSKAFSVCTKAIWVTPLNFCYLIFLKDCARTIFLFCKAHVFFLYENIRYALEFLFTSLSQSLYYVTEKLFPPYSSIFVRVLFFTQWDHI